MKLPVTRLPNADIPIVSVVVTQFGAAPSELEAQVTKTIEDGVSGVEGVKHIASSITDGVSVTTITFQLETNAGHNQPSGASQDRRMWLEFSAFDGGDRLLRGSSGNIADGEIEERPAHDPKHDAQLLMLRDRIYDAQGKPVHMFWQAAMSQAHPDGYESNVLPVATTTYIAGKHAVLKQYTASDASGPPARVSARLRMRPIGTDVLQDLVDSGDLDPAIAARMPTFTFATQIEWTPADGSMKTIAATAKPADCSTYRCLLDPSSPECR
jgi:hypothetical protein